MKRRWVRFSPVAYLGMLLAGTLNSAPPPVSVVGGPKPPGYTFGIDLIPPELRQAAKAMGADAPTKGEGGKKPVVTCVDSPT
jgi:hypothetical protein